MAEYLTTVAEVQDRIFGAMKQVEDVAVEAAGTVSQTVASLLPELSPLPFAAWIPQPVELVNAYYAFVDEYVHRQRAYARRMAKAIAPLTGKFVPAPRVTKKSSPKAA